MRDFPSCFGENGVQIADASSSSSGTLLPTINKTPQNLVTSIYHSKPNTSSSFIITITWSKIITGQNLSIQINDPTTHSSSNLQIKTNLFSKNRGTKILEKFTIFWDLSCAKFTSSPEPVEKFYLAITTNHELILFLGDMETHFHKKTNSLTSLINSCPSSVFVSKTEHIFGKKLYATTAQFCGKGRNHEIIIECDMITSEEDPFLLIRIDGKLVMQVKKLQWKFRGNYTILVDGLPVEVYWDVYGWFFGKLIGNGVFLFRNCGYGSGQPVMSWSGNLGKECGLSGVGFSLVLFAWRSE